MEIILEDSTKDCRDPIYRFFSEVHPETRRSVDGWHGNKLSTELGWNINPNWVLTMKNGTEFRLNSFCYCCELASHSNSIYGNILIDASHKEWFCDKELRNTCNAE